MFENEAVSIKGEGLTLDKAERLESGAYEIALGAVVAQLQRLTSRPLKWLRRKSCTVGLLRQTATNRVWVTKHLATLRDFLGPPPTRRRDAETIRYF